MILLKEICQCQQRQLNLTGTVIPNHLCCLYHGTYCGGQSLLLEEFTAKQIKTIETALCKLLIKYWLKKNSQKLLSEQNLRDTFTPNFISKIKVIKKKPRDYMKIVYHYSMKF